MNAAQLHHNIAQAVNQSMQGGEMSPSEVVFVLEQIKVDLLVGLREQTKTIIQKATQLPPRLEGGLNGE